MKIGYLTFGRDDFGYGMALCLSRLGNCELYRVTPKTARYVDVLLFSCFWWEHIYLFADFLKRAGIRKQDQNRPRVVVGGFNTFNPVPFLGYADAVVCGDGEEIIKQAVGGDYSSEHVLTSEKKTVTWCNVDPLRGFCHETNDIARIELARGCKFKCRFCAVTHLKPYRETPFEDVAAALRKTKLKRVSLFAPEPTMHVQDKDLTDLCHQLGKIRTDSDVRLDRLEKRDDSVPRVGIEGLSEKLRKSVNKPYSSEKIVGAVKTAIEHGRKGIFMYMILDLPGECEEDWEEFRDLLQRIGSIPGADGFLLKPSPSVFMPSPHTPMQFEAINYERDYGGKWSSFFGRGGDRQWRVIMAERSRVFSPAARVLSMLSTRSGNEFYEVEKVLTDRKVLKISGGRAAAKSLADLEKGLAPFGGAGKYCGPYTAESAPWKVLQIKPLSPA